LGRTVYSCHGYLVNHSSSDIFDDTVTFPDPENVDFDVLHVILLTFWVNFNMRYCVSGGHLEFSHLGSFPQDFTVAFFSLPIVYFIRITTSVILLVLQIPHFWAPICLANR